MLDYKIKTFLMLCKTMNYRITAEKLNMSQPSVTQHIHLLEEYYNTKLFIYDKKKLYKTDSAIILENHLASIVKNEEDLEKLMRHLNSKSIRLGATKTIGNYVINNKIIDLISNNYEVTFIIDNTKSLLNKLNNNELDILLIEGLFNKNQYDFKLFKREPFVGICSPRHEFANKIISLEQIFDQNLMIREEGSGTRFIFEQELLRNNFSIDNFKNINCISNFDLIKNLVKNNLGITFAYNAILNKEDNLATFTLKNNPIIREFNFVCLKHSRIEEYVKLFL